MSDYRSEAAARYPFNGSSGFDHKAWARRIIYREERKCSHLMPIQVTDAKMALDLMPIPNKDK